MASRTAVASNPSGTSEHPTFAFAALEGCEIQGVLARSSFAVLYGGYDPALQTHVAIKEYLPEALARHDAEGQVVLRDPGHAEAFERGLLAFVGEAELLARCEHPSLLHVLRVLRCRGTAFRVMRYHPCQTLLEYRQQQASPIAAETLRRWLDDLLDALQVVHDQGCVHGAVAPGNILMLQSLRPLLLDLDAVRGALVSDRTQDLMATLAPCFEPLEQRTASYLVAGPWTDLYSLAATLHFCIGGALPSPPRATAVAGRFEPLAAVWQRLRSGYPELDAAPDWLDALDAWLSDDPLARPPSVAQARAMLDAPRVTAHDLPAVVSPEPPIEVAPPVEQTSSVDATPSAETTPSSEPARPIEMAAPAAPGQDPAAGDGMATTRAPPWADLLPRATGRWQRLWTVGTVALLAMTTVVAITDWPEGRAGDADRPAGSPVVPVAEVPQVSQVAVQTLQTLRPPAVATVEAPTAPHAQPPDVPAAAAPAASVEAVLPVAAAIPAPASAPVPQAPAASAANDERGVRVASSPRQLCGARAGYELLRCMQTQCAKRSWTKHEQCRRLRQNRLS